MRPQDIDCRDAAAQLDADVCGRRCRVSRQLNRDEAVSRRRMRRTRRACSACRPGLVRVLASPFVDEISVQAMRERHLGNRRARHAALRQHRVLQRYAVLSPRRILGVFHGVHLSLLVDTILAGSLTRFKVGSPDAYGPLDLWHFGRPLAGQERQVHRIAQGLARLLSHRLKLGIRHVAVAP